MKANPRTGISRVTKSGDKWIVQAYQGPGKGWRKLVFPGEEEGRYSTKRTAKAKQTQYEAMSRILRK